ncbi:MAG: 4'-phosphopantetheinyl transferase family protein [Myxococcaceae bacterium]
MPRNRITLAPGEAHLWWVRPERINEPALLSAYWGMMTPEERDRHDRYRFENNRREFLLTRALARTTLSRYVDVPPSAWRFGANEHGCPHVLEPREGAHLRFNLSNTTGLVACLVSIDRELGVDVEPRERRGETVAIADRFFSPFEVDALNALPEAQRRPRFFEYWTLKEAYIKARGMGLALPLDQFSFHLEAQPIRISFGPKILDDPESWQFHQFHPTGEHLMATAIRREPGTAEIPITVRETVPLMD